MYKVEVKKAGQFDFEKVDLNIVEQEQLNILVSKFYPPILKHVKKC